MPTPEEMLRFIQAREAVAAEQARDNGWGRWAYRTRPNRAPKTNPMGLIMRKPPIDPNYRYADIVPDPYRASYNPASANEWTFNTLKGRGIEPGVSGGADTGVYDTPDGRQMYVKAPKGGYQHALAELTGLDILRLANPELVPKAEIVHLRGNPMLASEMMPDNSLEDLAGPRLLELLRNRKR